MYSSPHLSTDEAEAQVDSPPQLIVYANRINVTRFLRVQTNRLIISALFCILITYALNSMLASSVTRNSLAYFSLFLFVIAYALLLGKMVLNRWLTARSLLANNEPVLTITSEGIAMRGALSLTTVFLAWSEIESIEVYTFMYKYLCVRPRNMTLFMRRLPAWERLLRLIDMLYTMPPLTISLFYLDKPVEEILQQLYHMYAKELSYYHVQIRS